jgi:SAM-dependent methyltransferase
MSWGDVLTKNELQKFELNQEIARYLEESRQRLGLEKKDMRVLDWGCGRGEAVAYLAAQGYDAYGVDIDAPVIDRGQPALTKSGFDTTRLNIIHDDGKIDFPDDFFHFVYSYQVLEHVETLDPVPSEISRVTVPGGYGLHIYPGDRRIIEGHLFMPFVHWLPKNRLRKAAIYLFTVLGIEPNWREVKGKPKKNKADFYYDYSIKRTYYRSFNTVKDAFDRANFSHRLVILDHPRVRENRLLNKFLKSKTSARFLEWLIMTFQTVQLYTTKDSIQNKTTSG